MKARWIVRLLLVMGLALSFHSVLGGMAAAKKRVGPLQTPSGAGEPRQAQSFDDLLAEVARRVPAFGGMFIGPDMALHVYLTDITQIAAAEEAIFTVFGRERLPEGRIQAAQGQYGFLQLKAWHDLHRITTLAIPGVLSTNISKSRNRLRIGVSDPSLFGRVEEELSGLGIPLAAVEIVETEPVEFLQDTLQSTHRPLLGGLQITLDSGTCTLGFLAVLQGQAGFVTCSHCTDIQGGVEGTVYHQATISGVANRIGVERDDPQYFTGNPCPSGRRCRTSDSAFARRDSGPSQSTPPAEADFGFLALTDFNDLTLFNNKFQIVSEVPFPMDGESLSKVGKATGLTQGVVTDTCVDINAFKNGADSGITLLCQNRVKASVGPGDSGSPVFSWSSANLPPGAFIPANLYGILWGGDVKGTSFSFSPMSSIEAELGSLKTFPGDAGINSPPEVKIRKPANGASVGYGGLNIAHFQADIVDYEGCCTDVTWQSDKDGVIGRGAAIDYIFGGPGTRKVTVTATDNDGATAADIITVNVSNTPPTVKIIKPTPGQTLYKGFPYMLQGDSFDPNELGQSLPCNSLKWSSTLVGAQFGVVLGSGCALPVTFSSVGSYSIGLTGVDSSGAMGFANVLVNVVNAPANSPPVVTILNPADGAYLDPYAFVTLKATAVDPDNKNPVSYKWALQNGAVQTTLGMGNVNNSPQPQVISLPWKPATNVPFSCGGGTVRLYLYATDVDGKTGSAFVDVYIGYPPC